MNNIYSLSDSFSKLSGIEKALSSAAETLSRFTAQYHFDEIEKMSRTWDSIAKSTFRQFEQINHSLDTKALFSQIDQYERMLPQLDNALKALNTPAFQIAAEQIQAISQKWTFPSEDVLSRLTKTLEAYQTPSILAQMEHVLDSIPSFDPAIFDLAKSFDVDDVQFSDDGSISFDGENYKPEDIVAELSTQTDNAKVGKIPLREKAENLKKRLWLLLLIVNLIFSIPQIPETLDFYNNVVSEITTIIRQTEQICYTIRDRSYLRETANAKGKIIVSIPYDSALEIIDDIPRWYQVKYNDDDGNEYSGWISKISVEKGE